MIRAAVKQLLAGLLLFAAAVAPAYPAGPQRSAGDHLRSALQDLAGPSAGGPLLVLDGRRVVLRPELAAFYRERAFAPAWVAGDGPGTTGRALVDILRDVATHGLCAEDYHLPAIDALLELPAGLRGEPAVTAHWLARLDLLLSDAFLRYATHLVAGRIDPNRTLDGWRARPREIRAERLLAYVVESGRLQPTLEDLLPPHPGYHRLREALAEYRRQWLLGGWPVVPPGPVLQPGTADPRLPLLRARLQAEGDLAQPAAAGTVYDPATAAALERFQQRHGLRPDGVLGPATLGALNVPLAERIRRIELNLERWRWLPKTLGERHLRVNIADFSLTLVTPDEPPLTMAVVVGTSYRRTPVFSGRMRYLEFSPYWYVPPTILREDLLPKLRQDPGLLERRHFELVSWDASRLLETGTIDWRKVSPENFPGLLRQKPGPWNPLGRVKFMFPNPHAVYLHDTPDRDLFAEQVRSFSSGCIRIARPFELAARLLAGAPDPELAAALEGLDGSAPLRVDLPDSLPVHLLYWTAWVDEDGRVHFRDDIYWRDVDLEMALAPPPEEPEAALTARRPPPVLPGG